jgi:hypothetical protein
MILVMEAIYGKEEYRKSGHPNWNTITNRPTYKYVAKQGPNQCGFFCLKFSSAYDGIGFVEPIHDRDVCFQHLFTCLM